MGRILRATALAMAIAVIAYGAPGAAASAAAVDLPAFGAARLRFDEPKYQVGGCARLELSDAAPNADPAKPDTVDVAVRSFVDRESMSLLETGTDTDEFTSGEVCLPLAAADSGPGDGTLRVTPGDMIGAAELVSNGDKQEAPRALDVALIAGGDAAGSWTTEVDPSILPENLSSTPSRPGMPDLPLAAVRDPDGSTTMFGLDHVLIRPSSPKDMTDFLERRDATVLDEVVMPVPEKDRREGYPSEVTFYVVHVDPASFDATDTAFLVERYLDAKGSYTYSSADAVKLLGLVLEEQLGGTVVELSALLQPQGFPMTNEGPHGSVFGHPWFDNGGRAPRVGAGQTLALLETIDHRQNGTPVATAIIDGGFAQPSDYPANWGLSVPASLDYGQSFNSASRCSFDALAAADCGPGAAGGQNPLSCSGGNPCPWHGFQMFSTAGAEFNNGFGTTGVGAQVVDPRLYKIGFPYLAPAGEAIRRAVDDGARVINLSSGTPCAPLLVNLCTPSGALAALPVAALACGVLIGLFEVVGALGCAAILSLLFILPIQGGILPSATNYAESRDVVITASAGNSSDDVDDKAYVPCTLSAVVCVGSLRDDGSNLDHSDFSSFGRSVDIWAPGEAVPVTPDPQAMQTPNPNVPLISGTSPAAAFVAGTVALIRSIGPSMSAAQARTILLVSRCGAFNRLRVGGARCTPSPSARINPAGYVDVLDAVHRARQAMRRPELVPCTGGFDEAGAGAHDTYGLGRSIGPLTSAGATVRLNGDLSIHALPRDEDWYRFQVPNLGAPTTEMAIELHVPEVSHGFVFAELYRETTAGVERITTARTDTGSATIRGAFFRNAFMGLRVYSPTPESRYDACYGGNTLTFRVIREGPRADRFENNDYGSSATRLEGWSHRHYSPTVRQSDEVWSMNVGDLSLHTSADRDYFRLALPDPTATRDDGHPALTECGGESSIGEDVVHRGVFAARVRSSQPLYGENLELRSTGTQELLVGGGGAFATYRCPRTLGHNQLLIGLGERTTTRPSALPYSLELEYKVQVTRSVPRWVMQLEALERGVIEAWGCPIGFVPGCGGRVGGGHPIDPNRLRMCWADGCPEFFLMNVESSGVLDLTFVTDEHIDFELFDSQQNLVARAEPMQEPLPFAAPSTANEEEPEPDQSQPVTQRMYLSDLTKGFYVLRVVGPPSPIEMQVKSIPTGQRSITLGAAPKSVKADGYVRFSGRVDSGNPACRGGETVELQVAKPGSTRFTRIATRKTDAAGVYSIRLRVGSTRLYRAVTPRAGVCEGATSPSVGVRVR